MTKTDTNKVQTTQKKYIIILMLFCMHAIAVCIFEKKMLEAWVILFIGKQTWIQQQN